MDAAGGKWGKIVLLVVVTVVISLLHFITPTHPHQFHEIHIALRKLYFLPPIMAAAWFGIRGASAAALGVSVLFGLHAILDWPGNYMEQANQVGELVGFWVTGGIAGVLFDRQRHLLSEISVAHQETLLSLVSALDLREHNTRLHSQRVREYTELMATRLGLGESDRREIGFGALLHDIGKIAVPDRILLKPDKLTEEEWQQMRKHPDAGYLMVKRIGFLARSAEIIRSHHERYDGRGYPLGLTGKEIPLGARLFMVADVYDALTTRRSYHEAMSHEAAVEEIRREQGKHFDPAVVETFVNISSDDLLAIAARYRD